MAGLSHPIWALSPPRTPAVVHEIPRILVNPRSSGFALPVLDLPHQTSPGRPVKVINLLHQVWPVGRSGVSVNAESMLEALKLPR
jgi:hypothetical protein